MGKCPNCNTWNSLTEEIEEPKKRKQKLNDSLESDTIKLNNVENADAKRLLTRISEFDRVLGGGFIPGSVVLIGGDPGIGKSTLVLQIASKVDTNVLYVTGEESLQQLSLRARRLKLNTDNIDVINETDLELILSAVKKINPSLVIIDSIQTMNNPELENAAGTVSQIRDCTNIIMQEAKKNGFTAVIIGHVTKEGFIAGPKVLEHIVDTVLQFEGENTNTYRILRAAKNRFGNTNEIGIFEMHEDGLHEVKNPSQIFINDRETNSTGSVISASIEGTRPVLMEIQALVTPSHYGNPQRVATGFDYRRLSLLIAVLEKRAGLKLSQQNVFLNIAGGLKINEPAVDLAICCAIASSYKERNVKEKNVVIGEVGLGGEIRNVSFIEKRINEAVKLGFANVFVPKKNKESLKVKFDINIAGIENVKEAIDKILE
jgi:DNA repair protein RadA/Sms